MKHDSFATRQVGSYRAGNYLTLGTTIIFYYSKERTVERFLRTELLNYCTPQLAAPTFLHNKKKRLWRRMGDKYTTTGDALSVVLLL